MENKEKLFIENFILCATALIFISGMCILGYNGLTESRQKQSDYYIISDKYDSKEVDTALRVSVTGTVYNPVKAQCDSDPLITADNSKIDLDELKKGNLNWIAISRDLRKDFKYGTDVFIECESDPSINGIYKVKDTMHPRWTYKIDFFHYSKTLGKWDDIVMTRID